MDSLDRENIKIINSQVGSGDVVLTENLGRYPSRPLHKALLYNKPKKNIEKVIIIRRGAKICDGLLYYMRSMDPSYGPMVINKSSEFNILTDWFVTTNDIISKYDIICFGIDLYRGRLADMSSFMEYNQVMEFILRPVKHKIMVNVSHDDKLPVPGSYYHISDSFVDLPIEQNIVLCIEEVELSGEECLLDKRWNCYKTESITEPQIVFDVEFEKICVSFDLETI